MVVPISGLHPAKGLHPASGARRVCSTACSRYCPIVARTSTLSAGPSTAVVCYVRRHTYPLNISRRYCLYPLHEAWEMENPGSGSSITAVRVRCSGVPDLNGHGPYDHARLQGLCTQILGRAVIPIRQRSGCTTAKGQRDMPRQALQSVCFSSLILHEYTPCTKRGKWRIAR